jgi:ribosomal protein S18 acetylase RimI-like enzyme
MDELTAVVIREATVADAPLVAELAARLFEQTFGPVNTPEDMAFYLANTFSVDRQAAELSDPDRSTLLAFDDTGTAIGFAMMRRGSRSNGIVGERPVEIQRIYADRSMHGRGLGHRLMNSCVEQVRAWTGDVLWLAVWEKNARAIAFYTRVGFTAVGVQDFVLGSDVQHDLVMSRGV